MVNFLGVMLERVGSVEGLLQQITIAGNRGQQVVEVMGNPAG
jgi:hypothetical protein